MDGLSLVDVVFGDRHGGDFLDLGNPQMLHAGLEALVVGGEKDRSAVSHGLDDRRKQFGMIPGDVEFVSSDSGGGIRRRIHDREVEASPFALGILHEIKGIGLHQGVRLPGDSVEFHVLPCLRNGSL